jgi:hypothetical protein
LDSILKKKKITKIVKLKYPEQINAEEVGKRDPKFLEPRA